MVTAEKIDLESLVKTELPPLPDSALRVANLAQDLNTPARKLAEAIGADPALATQVLRVANSPLYSMERNVVSLSMAVNTLGNNAVHMLVMMIATSGAFNKNRRSRAEQALWEHSFAVGLAARELSAKLGMRGGEEAFLCGLLHDIGKVLLLRHDSNIYPLEESGESGLLEREQERYGFTHAQVGALAARRWGLPEEISYTIYNHHQPSEAGQFMFSARVIDVADGLANAAGVRLRQSEEQQQNLAEAESVIALRLSGEMLAEVWQKVEADLRQTRGLFN